MDQVMKNTGVLPDVDLRLSALQKNERRNQGAALEVYERLRRAIVEGELRPNEPLIEADLAKMLNVSRTPIRESLQRLAADQLVTPRKRGWAVREYSVEEIRERSEVRAALEGYAARLAATRATDDEIAAIASIQDERDGMTELTPAYRVESNRRFHDAIIAAARNTRLADDIFRVGQFYFNRHIAGLTTAEEQKLNQHDHREIIAALVARDARGAEDAMRTHILNAFTVFQRIVGF
ncbi:DNA-binding transcriptional regulator, GntR family [Mesorhizobium albiziae]|uniref:DNA-binding transcriptional regulator, GntR family n=1 Tax=Neomesorhizobium albiziae TaxID=335020 RepID=A0A1I4BVT5_9HYPH|nr:GntR family transcriptional regulator [Mesorhizobium albiziae]GLS29625.1 GntR family transcriptional regulator [Mesorhizobium albiziae]SFK72892.1 DNA-binding transcriptional regulator, GntR family [Mesorhizobium albiziae]